MLDTLARITRSAYWWLALLLYGFTSEAVALFYQHVLGEWPCVLCIQMRLWMVLLISIALLVLVLRRYTAAILTGQLLVVVAATGMLERSWQLLGTERGFLEGDCGFDLGLPAWFRPDQWLPALFEVQTSCGYTPELLFGITMAEALIVTSALLLLVALVLMLGLALAVRRDNGTRL